MFWSVYVYHFRGVSGRVVIRGPTLKAPELWCCHSSLLCAGMWSVDQKTTCSSYSCCGRQVPVSNSNREERLWGPLLVSALCREHWVIWDTVPDYQESYPSMLTDGGEENDLQTPRADLSNKQHWGHGPEQQYDLKSVTPERFDWFGSSAQVLMMR